jgi:hypothetical protein
LGNSPLHALLWLARVLVEPQTRISDSPTQPSRWTRAREWLHRYGLAELGGVTGALVGSFVVRRVTGNAIAAAYGGAWGESLGYAITVIVRDFATASRDVKSERRRLRFADVGRVFTGLAAEFGPSGALDTFVTRPLAMALGARAFGLQAGVVVGKLAADVVFYVPVIMIYERRKQRRRRSTVP